jgi:hypothetical protein
MILRRFQTINHSYGGSNIAYTRRELDFNELRKTRWKKER